MKNVLEFISQRRWGILISMLAWFDRIGSKEEGFRWVTHYFSISP